MNYNGKKLSENFSISFLKKALQTVNINNPYRAVDYFHDGDYTYTSSVEGDFNYFHGNETIFFQDQKVYECSFQGGEVK